MSCLFVLSIPFDRVTVLYMNESLIFRLGTDLGRRDWPGSSSPMRSDFKTSASYHFISRSHSVALQYFKVILVCMSMLVMMKTTMLSLRNYKKNVCHELLCPQSQIWVCNPPQIDPYVRCVISTSSLDMRPWPWLARLYPLSRPLILVKLNPLKRVPS
jgi:hypothetical protein